jgi:integrase
MAVLKNVTRVETTRFGQKTWILLDNAGSPIEAFSHFCEKNSSYAYATQKRYAEVVSQFIDYLIESNVFGQPATKSHLNAVIDAYPVFLRDGSDLLCSRLMQSVKDHPEDLWLLVVAQELTKPPLKPSSFSNILAAINRFLRLSESLAIEAFERASIAGIKHDNHFQNLIGALSGADVLSEAEKRKLRQNSMLGSVIRFKGEGLTRPRRLKTITDAPQQGTHHLDFPIESVMRLVNATISWRDKALWLLLAASGIRVSEALNLRWSDIDIENQKVFVLDPNGRRFGGDMTPLERTRFKGRTVSMTYLIQPFRQNFFQALEQYVKCEYVPLRGAGRESYVFQYVESQRRGTPYVGVSDAALNSNFQSACSRAEINGQQPSNTKKWTIHSLRHLYGVYMLNDYPIDISAGKYGLDLVEVQMLMGHANISSTRHYARKKRRNLASKLEQADLKLLGMDASHQFQPLKIGSPQSK